MTMGNTLNDVKEDVTNRTSGDVEHLRESFNQLRCDVMDLLGAAFGVGRSGMGAVKDQAAGAVEQLKGRMHELTDKGGEYVGTVGKKVEDNPIQSALIAFGVGFILAKLLSRR